jgi:hypothetical protein
MEELKKLEQVQRTLEFMESRGIATSSDRDSNRFLTDLIALLVISATLLPNSRFCNANFFPNSFWGNFFEPSISHIFPLLIWFYSLKNDTLKIQPCGEMGLEKKCSLVSEHMPKASDFLNLAIIRCNG